MADKADSILFVCSCERSMRPDLAAIGRACPSAELRAADHLCRAGIGAFEAALAEDRPVHVACRQEAPVFRETAEARGQVAPLSFTDIRNSAGWSSQAARAGPKMAALLAAGQEPVAATPFVTFRSEGVALILGRDEVALDVARRLADRLDLTVLLTRPGDIAPPRLGDIPVFKGVIKSASGHLGAFDLVIDGFAAPSPASRARLEFGPARDGAKSRADIIIDVGGGQPLFAAPDLRSGYLRADPADPAALARVVFEAAGLVGAFDTPRYIDFNASLCAHSRSRKTGCTRCLDLCPTGAITPAGDHVAIDPHICAGCGACASVCPTGAAAYALPPADALMRRLRRLLIAYHEAGGGDAVVLLHDEAHGAPLIDALARHGDGLPAHVLPVEVNEITQIGPECVALCLALGARGIAFLARAKPRHDIESARRAATLGNTLAAALGYGEKPVSLIETDDPDALAAAFATPVQDGVRVHGASAFLPQGDKHGVFRMALKALHAAAPNPVAVVALPDKAPYGRVVVDAAGCTLCLACVSACPANALLDNPEKPQLRFNEEACVQCGLCVATCPENVITLEPRMNFAALGAPPIVLKEEAPFHCIRCAKPFGVRSIVERVSAKLEQSHWMFQGAGKSRLDLVRMCDDCRVAVVTDRGLDPYAGPARPKPRTAEDYRKQGDDDV